MTFLSNWLCANSRGGLAAAMLVALVTQKEKLKAWTGVRRLAAGVRVGVQKARKGKDSGMQVQAVLSYLRVHGLVDGSPPVGALSAFIILFATPEWLASTSEAGLTRCRLLMRAP
jgi:hypothetical protein